MDHRSQVRRNHRNHVEDHRPRFVGTPPVLVAAVERSHDLEPLYGLLLALGGQGLLALGRIDHRPELDLFVVEVDLVDELCQRIGTHTTLEVVTPAVDQLTPEQIIVDDLACEQGAELVPRPIQDVELGLVLLTDEGQVLAGRPLASTQVGILGPFCLELSQLGLEVLLSAIKLAVALLFDGGALLDQLLFELGEVLVALVLVDPDNEAGSKVDDLLQLLGLELLAGLGAHQQVRQPRPGSAQVPNVDGRCRQLDVAHAFTPDLRARDLDPAALTDNALEADALVLAAVALPVLGRTEDLLTEEPVLFRLERAVVDGLRLLHLTVGPHAYAVGGGKANPKLVEIVDVEHSSTSYVLSLGICH